MAPARSIRTWRSARLRQMLADGYFAPAYQLRKAGEELRQGGRQGRAEGDVEDGHLDAAKLSRRADLRGHRAQQRVRRRILHAHAQPHRRRRPGDDRRRVAPPSRACLPADRSAGNARARRRRAVSMAPQGRSPHLQSRGRRQAAARHADQQPRGVPQVLPADRRAAARNCSRCAVCWSSSQADAAGAAG